MLKEKTIEILIYLKISIFYDHIQSIFNIRRIIFNFIIFLFQFYCVFISLLICGNFVPVPRVLSETMPFSYTAVIFRYTEVLLNVANFTMVAMLLGITVIILKNKIMYYMVRVSNFTCLLLFQLFRIK